MIYIDISLSANTFYTHTIASGNGYSLMVLENVLLRDELRFKIWNGNTSSLNIFTIYPVSATTLVDYNTAKLYLDNRSGYNYYKIYYDGGVVNSYYMTEDKLVSEGLMYIINPDEIKYSPTYTSGVTSAYTFTYD